MRATRFIGLSLSGLVQLGAVLLPSLTFADEVRMLRGTPSKAQILEVLGPAPVTSGLRTRGLSLAAGSQQAVAPVPRKLDLEVLFDFDSDQLTGQGREVLDQLGAALNADEMRGVRSVTFEGHTDARGSEAYNLDLSARRARSVRDYLVSHHQLARGRTLAVLGKGAHELANPIDPEDAINRRVRIVVDQ